MKYYVFEVRLGWSRGTFKFKLSWGREWNGVADFVVFMDWAIKERCRSAKEHLLELLPGNSLGLLSARIPAERRAHP